MPPQQALVLAKQKGLDLVEVSPTALPPVCRIMDFGRYQYTEQKRAREAKRHQKTIEVKEIKFRPKVDEHDYQFKKKHIERFLADGDKVKGDDLLPGPGNRAPGNRTPHSRTVGEGTGRRRDPGDLPPSGGQHDAHDFVAAQPGQGRRQEGLSRTMPKLKTHRGAAKRFQAHGHRQAHAQQSVQTAHPHQQEHEAEAQASRLDDRLDGRPGPAGSDDSTEVTRTSSERQGRTSCRG